jgi:hypothetical protein
MSHECGDIRKPLPICADVAADKIKIVDERHVEIGIAELHVDRMIADGLVMLGTITADYAAEAVRRKHEDVEVEIRIVLKHRPANPYVPQREPITVRGVR